MDTGEAYLCLQCRIHSKKFALQLCCFWGTQWNSLVQAVVSFLEADGSLVSSSYDRLNARRAWVSASTVCMWSDGEVAEEGKRDENGLNKCYSVLLQYSHHLPRRSGCVATAYSPHRKATCSFPSASFPARVPQLMTRWHKLDGKIQM